MHVIMHHYLVLFLISMMKFKTKKASSGLLSSLDDRSGVIRYNVIRTLDSGEQEKKALNETRIGAQIQLIKAFRAFIGKSN